MRRGVSVGRREFNIIFKNGWSPIHYACYGGSVQIVQELIRRGAKTKAVSKVFLFLLLVFFQSFIHLFRRVAGLPYIVQAFGVM